MTVEMVMWEGDVVNEVLTKGGRVRNVIQGSDGYIYLGIDGKGIIQLLP